MRNIINHCLAAMLILAVLLSAPAPAAELRVGVVSAHPVEIIASYDPLTQYLASRLQKYNISAGKVVVTMNLREMLEEINKGRVDVFFESVFGTLEAAEKCGMAPTLLVWKKGVRDYKSLFFTRRDGPIFKLQDLKGKIIAFEDPSSTSAYLIPKAELRRRGLAVVPLQEKAHADAVNYVFTKEALNQAFHVIQKKVHAGAYSSDDWKDTAPRIREELKIFHETKPILRFLASFHSSLTVPLQHAMAEILVQMHKDPDGLKALKAAARTTRIERLTEEDFRSLADMKTLMQFIEP